MPSEPLSPSAFAFIAQIDEAYTSLMRHADPHLGGKLFYAGNLTQAARAATVAANIAGAATLAASAGHAAAKQSMRDGIVDFLVNSLDEALRILKNQIRKRETAAVCVTAASETIEREMQARGVQPDLILTAGSIEFAHAPIVLDMKASAGNDADTWLTWRASQSPALWLPKLDAIALGILPPNADHARRWLQRAPRYLGRLAQNLRVLHTTQQHAEQFIAQLTNQIATGTITAPIEIDLGPWGHSHRQSLVPSPKSLFPIP
ncbi:MAG: hypothetical protein WBE38_14565 [Terracidiphilus sp.]